MITGGEKRQAYLYLNKAGDYFHTGKTLKNGIKTGSSMSERKRGRYPGIRCVKDNVYEISYYPYPGAPRTWRRIEAGSLHEAYIKRADLMSQYGKDSPAVSLSFPQLKARLEQKLKADNLTPKSIKNYTGKFDKMTSFLAAKGIVNINQLTRVLVESYKQYVVSEHPASWRDELTKIKAIVRKLVDIGCCEESIYKMLCEFKKPPRSKKLYKDITKKQIAKLLKFIEKDRPDYYGITYVIARLGWRIGQTLSIKRENIKWHKNTPIELQVDPQDTKTKVPFIFRGIDRELAEVIKCCSLHNSSLYLFPNRAGRKHNVGHYRDYLKVVSRKVIGVTLTPHDFRHVFCTTMLKEGHAPRDIMAITGHRDTDSFNIYTHPTSEGTKKVIEKSRIF